MKKIKIKVDLNYKEVMGRLPLSDRGTMVERPKKGKGSYKRKNKHKRSYNRLVAI